MGDVIANIVGIVIFIFLIFLSIGLLHEFGQSFATAAKHHGVKVTEFAFRLARFLWSRSGRDPVTASRLSPSAGYVRIIGMYPPGRPDQPEPTGRFG